MMNNEDFKISVVSSISDDYIDEATAERITAKKRVAKRKRTLTALASVAAAIIILIGAALPMLMLGGKQVPVYTGMTVSSEHPLSPAEVHLSINPLAAGAFSTGSPVVLGKPLKDAAKDYFNVTAGKAPYYAKPGDEIYITVTFDNPDDFVILSFTLNGKSYSSYMFEEGSDMENIVLKVEVGDQTGLISYTIDAIKYVDGDKIKDVRIGGDRTVNIGVYNENQPTASITDLSFDFTKVSFNADVTDNASLINAVDGRVYAIIYDGDRVVAQREIAADEGQSISFDGLSPMTEYTAAIVAVFDAYDGRETAPHVLCEESFTTRISAFAKNITVNDDDVSFELFYANDGVSVTKIELVDALGAVIAESDTPIDEFKDVPGGRLFIRVSYSYVSEGVTHSDESVTSFVCAKGMLPIIGEISAHYDSGTVFLPPPMSVYFEGHFGVDIVPTTDNTEVYSITDGVITNLIKSSQTANGCGRVEILDENGVYHFYKFLNTADLAVGDKVEAGDVLGTLSDPRENDMTAEIHLHYECYTLDGEARVYLVPSFDPEPRTISEQERLEKIAMSENMLISGELYVSGAYGSTVIYTTSFDLTYDDERVVLNLVEESEHVVLEKLDNGQYNIICSFENVTEPVNVRLRNLIIVANNTAHYCEYITIVLTPTAEP